MIIDIPDVAISAFIFNRPHIPKFSTITASFFSWVMLCNKRMATSKLVVVVAMVLVVILVVVMLIVGNSADTGVYI